MAENIYIPERKDFLVKPVSTYLGFVMGPVANASRIFGAAGHCHFGEQGADLSMPETTAGKAPDEKCTTRPVPQRLLGRSAAETTAGKASERPGKKGPLAEPPLFNPLGGYGTTHDSLAAGSLCPLLAFWDFAAAFPSVLHAWILIIIEVCSVPDGLRQIIRTMYKFVECYVVVEGRFFFAYYVWNGVFLGCPSRA